MAYPFVPKQPTPPAPAPAPAPPPAASPPQITPAHTLADLARVAVLWSLLGLGLVGGGVGFVWLVTSPDDIDAQILTLTGRGRP